MKDVSWLSRTELIVKSPGIERLNQSHVLVVGLGGVGSFAAEFLARSGIGKMTIVDGDAVDPTNRNRQLVALATNHGEKKASIMADRLKAISPEIELTVIDHFLQPDAADQVLDCNPDYVVDAIDSITPKLHLISGAMRRQLKLVSSMGAGGKLDPTQMQVADISKTYICPFAQQVRKQLKTDYGIRSGFQAVFSAEVPRRDSIIFTDGSNFKKSAYGTMSYLPAVFGATCSSVVVRGLLGKG